MNPRPDPPPGKSNPREPAHITRLREIGEQGRAAGAKTRAETFAAAGIFFCESDDHNSDRGCSNADCFKHEET